MPISRDALLTFTITPRERDTLVAALRYYQFYRLQGHPFDPAQDDLIDTIAAGGSTAGRDAPAPLDLAEVDDLCVGLIAQRRPRTWARAAE